MFKPGFFRIAILVLCLACPMAALAQAAFFSYQGELRSNGQPFNGSVDLEFSLWNDPDSDDASTHLIGSEIKSDVPVVNGLFQVDLINVGPTTIWRSFTANWLQVTVDPGGSNEQILSPRQHLSPAPNAWVSKRGTSYGGVWSVFNAAGEHTFLVYPDGRTSIGEYLDLYSGNASSDLDVPTIYGTAANNLAIRAGGKNGTVFFNTNSGSGSVRFHNGTGSGELMRLTRDGDLGIGTDSPQARLHVDGGNAAFMTQVGINTTSPDSNLHVAGATRTTFLILQSSDTVSGGTILCRANSGLVGRVGPCSASSRHLKDDIEALGGASELLAALEPVRFSWKADGRPDIGLIAEEVAATIPELVTRGDDGEIQGVNYLHLTAVLVGAWQEQQAEIASQQHEILALRAELQAEREATAARLAALENLLLDGPAVAQGRRRDGWRR